MHLVLGFDHGDHVDVHCTGVGIRFYLLVVDVAVVVKPFLWLVPSSFDYQVGVIALFPTKASLHWFKMCFQLDGNLMIRVRN